MLVPFLSRFLLCFWPKLFKIRPLRQFRGEEKILRLHDAKRKLADNFLEGTSEARSLSLEELRALCGNR